MEQGPKLTLKYNEMVRGEVSQDVAFHAPAQLVLQFLKLAVDNFCVEHPGLKPCIVSVQMPMITMMMVNESLTQALPELEREAE